MKVEIQGLLLFILFDSSRHLDGRQRRGEERRSEHLLLLAYAPLPWHSPCLLGTRAQDACRWISDALPPHTHSSTGQVPFFKFPMQDCWPWRGKMSGLNPFWRTQNKARSWPCPELITSCRWDSPDIPAQHCHWVRTVQDSHSCHHGCDVQNALTSSALLHLISSGSHIGSKR